MRTTNYFSFYTQSRKTQKIQPGGNRVLYAIQLLAVILLTGMVTSCHKSSEEKSPFGTCKQVAPQGHLSYSASTNTYTFRTHGGGTVKIDLGGTINISDDNYPGFTLEFWGGTTNTTVSAAFHENLNGKHVKDRINARRTIIFPDGAKITMVADILGGPTRWINIFDGGEMHHINMDCSTLEFSTTNNASFVQQIDNKEADGETGTFEISATGLLYLNIYTEDTPGNKINSRVPIGELSRANPNQVNDYWP